MESYRLFKAIEDGKLLVHNPQQDPEKAMMIEPYRTADNELGFHLYGWGSAVWSTPGIIARILSHPQEFWPKEDLRLGGQPNGRPATPLQVGETPQGDKWWLPQPVTFDLPHEGSKVMLWLDGEKEPRIGERIGLNDWLVVGEITPRGKVTHFNYLPTAPTTTPADSPAPTQSGEKGGEVCAG